MEESEEEFAKRLASYSEKKGFIHPSVKRALDEKHPLELIRKPARDFGNLEQANKWAESLGGYCAGLFRLQGTEYWYCYVWELPKEKE